MRQIKNGLRSRLMYNLISINGTGLDSHTSGYMETNVWRSLSSNIDRKLWTRISSTLDRDLWIQTSGHMNNILDISIMKDLNE